MLRIASLNLNKRLGNPTARAALNRWLLREEIGVIAVQEPVRPPSQGEQLPIDGYRCLGCTQRVAYWAKEDVDLEPATFPLPYVARLEIGYLVVLNCYLDAYKQETRATQLREIALLCEREGDRPLIVLGDFNIAPAPEDGLINGKVSLFNTDIDRIPLAEMLYRAHLIDIGARRRREFTICRQIGERLSEFRCDLALVSDYIARDYGWDYDHSVRMGETKFTDHSAIKLTLPVTVKRVPFENGLLFDIHANDPTEDITVVDEAYFCPHKTAMARRDPSPVAVQLAERIRKCHKTSTILDYGCGRGTDVRYYRELGFDADGYDPFEEFGWSVSPSRTYACVTVVFVLNVVINPWARLETLKRAASYAEPKGLVVVVTRSPAEIESHAAKRRWKKHNDGYWSHEQRGTFQKGIGPEELTALSKRAGLVLADESSRFNVGPSATVAVFTKPVRDVRS